MRQLLKKLAHPFMRGRELHKCIRHLGWHNGCRYWKMQRQAALNPEFTTNWIKKLKATAAVTHDIPAREAYLGFAELLETNKNTLPEIRRNVQQKIP